MLKKHYIDSVLKKNNLLNLRFFLKAKITYLTHFFLVRIFLSDCLILIY